MGQRQSEASTSDTSDETFIELMSHIPEKAQQRSRAVKKLAQTSRETML